jgi:hypothetical protein
MKQLQAVIQNILMYFVLLLVVTGFLIDVIQCRPGSILANSWYRLDERDGPIYIFSMAIKADGDTHVLTLGAKTYNKRPYGHLYIAPILVDLLRYRYRRSPMYRRSEHVFTITSH